MKRILYVIIIGLSFLAPLERADIAKLEPVEAVGLLKTDGQISIITDTGAQGTGRNAEEALHDLILNTAGIIYLDTAEYLLVSESAVGEIELIRDDLKGSVKLCRWDGNGELKDAVKYFSVHGDFPQLHEWDEQVELPQYVSKK